MMALAMLPPPMKASEFMAPV